MLKLLKPSVTHDVWLANVCFYHDRSFSQYPCSIELLIWSFVWSKLNQEKYQQIENIEFIDFLVTTSAPYLWKLSYKPATNSVLLFAYFSWQVMIQNYYLDPVQQLIFTDAGLWWPHTERSIFNYFTRWSFDPFDRYFDSNRWNACPNVKSKYYSLLLILLIIRNIPTLLWHRALLVKSAHPCFEGVSQRRQGVGGWVMYIWHEHTHRYTHPMVQPRDPKSSKVWPQFDF